MVKGRCQDKCSTDREPFNLEKDKETLGFIYILCSKKYFLTFLDELTRSTQTQTTPKKT